MPFVAGRGTVEVLPVGCPDMIADSRYLNGRPLIQRLRGILEGSQNMSASGQASAEVSLLRTSQDAERR